MNTGSLENPPVFDFDHWSKLARSDPEQFEARRAAVIEAAIRRAPKRNQTRLRRLQWKLDQVRKTSATPLAACIRMNEMMWDRITGHGGLLEALGQTPRPRGPRPAGDVVAFLPRA
ncbi:DUF3135 domain-containing protein [Thiohalobacter sp. IOR34]|uniref:DUF3135 domain-containing protein n=1 Tax=Thiohalobacter sp. IOR34 TaxID=3057176 RepID=UPI0025B0297C|nr:DUF3135 domain-containing protein [Thiohalobacter sp. IOR34]WJW75696.1 DUF3135 domain-containing protein [Thiohalobacter sp. IOR34]